MNFHRVKNGLISMFSAPTAWGQRVLARLAIDPASCLCNQQLYVCFSPEYVPFVKLNNIIRDCEWRRFEHKGQAAVHVDPFHQAKLHWFRSDSVCPCGSRTLGRSTISPTEAAAISHESVKNVCTFPIVIIHSHKFCYCVRKTDCHCLLAAS